MTKGKRRELQTRLAKFICHEIMDDDWKLGRKLCMAWADEIIEMVRLSPECGHIEPISSLKAST